MATVEHCLFCFETLAANLERRSAMTLHQVQSSWADYPKGLDDDEVLNSGSADEDDTVGPSSAPTIPSAFNNTSQSRLQALQRVSASRSSSSVASSSSSSLDPSTAASTPPTFVPVGQHPRRTSQRSSSITESPLFVTWNRVTPDSSSSRSLRGCIGTFETLPLTSGLASYAITSSLHDTRFFPITLRELPTLEVSVTLLTDFESAKDAMDWELGVHGVRISFYARNKRYGACYLPDVAVEQGWDKEETIVSLMRKAGWKEKRDEKWRDVGDFKLVRFQGKAESVGYDEFKSWKEWVSREKK